MNIVFRHASQVIVSCLCRSKKSTTNIVLNFVVPYRMLKELPEAMLCNRKFKTRKKKGGFRAQMNQYSFLKC